jgi:curved DNA-binding protein CbpA
LLYLPKPFSLMDLGRQISRILEGDDSGRARVRELLRDAAASDSITGFVPTVDDPDDALGTPAPSPKPAPSTGSRSAFQPLDDPAGVSLSEMPAVMRDSSPSAGPLSTGRHASQPGKAASDESNRYIEIDTGRRLPKIGDLRAAEYVQLLTTLFHSHSSARLVLESDGTRRTMYFLNGYPVWVDVSHPMEGLPAWLDREGRLDKTQVAALARETGRGSTGLRRRLVDLGILDPAELDAALESWIQAEVRDGLGRVGHYQLSRADDFAGTIPVYEVNPIRAIWAGLPDHVSQDDVRQELDSLAAREVGRTRTFNRLFGYIATTPLLRQLGEMLLRPRSVQEVRARFPDSGPEVGLCLWFLIHAGLVALSDSPRSRAASTPERPAPRSSTPAAPQPRPARTSPTATSRPASPKPTAEPDAPVEYTIEVSGFGRPSRDRIQAVPAAKPGLSSEDLILRDYVTRIDLDHYGFLQVDDDATGEQIEAAYSALAPRYRLRNLADDVQGDTRRKAKELLTRLVRAFDELGQPERRAAYDVRLERQRRTGGFADRVQQDSEVDFSSVSTTGMPAVTTPAPLAEVPRSTWWPGSADPSALSRRRARLGQDEGDALVAAHQAMGRSDFQAAAGLLDMLRAQLPSDPDVLAELGWCRFALAPRKTRAIDKAMEWIDLALAFRPDSLAALEAKARILCTTDRTDEAVTAVKRLQRKAPDSSWAREQLVQREEKVATPDKARGLRRLWGRKK